MLTKSVIASLVGLLAFVEGSALPADGVLVERQGGRGGKNNGGGGAQAAANPTCLNANAVQTGSASTGQNAAVAADGQVNSAT